MFDLSGAAQSHMKMRGLPRTGISRKLLVSFLLVEFPKGRSLLFAQPKMK